MTTNMRNSILAGLLAFIPCSGFADLNTAVDNSSVAIDTSGDGLWMEVPSPQYAGGDSAQSGSISHSMESILEVSVTGPGVLAFVMKVSSEECCDGVDMFLDGSTQWPAWNFRGQKDWQHLAIGISGGAHKFSWKYSKNASFTSGSDAAWVDSVYFVSSGSTFDVAWTGRPLLTNPRQGLAAVATDSHIWVIGGRNGGAYRADVEHYNPNTHSVVTKAGIMTTARANFAAVVHENIIYAIGGETSGTSKSSVERYNTLTDMWSPETGLNTARYGLGAAVVDGKIYAIGGRDASAFSTVEEHNAVSGGGWSYKTSMPTARSHFGIAAVNRKIYVIGGRDSVGTDLDVVEEYDAVNDSWQTRASLPVTGSDFGVAVVHGMIYCIGPGMSQNVYNPVGDTWVTLTGSPLSVQQAGCVAIDGNIWVLGGEDAGSAQPTVSQGTITITPPAASAAVSPLVWSRRTPMNEDRYRFPAVESNGIIHVLGGYANTSHTSATEQYNYTTNSWSPGPNLPGARSRHAGAAWAGALYAIGGWDGSSYWDALDRMSGGNWGTLSGTPLPLARYGLSAVEVNGDIYAIGGFDGTYRARVDKFNASTQVWTTMAPMPTARRYAAAAVIDGRIYVVGGYNGSMLGTVEVYDPGSNTWSTRPDMPTWRWGLAAVALNGNLYAIGGYDGTTYHDDVERYDPAINTWSNDTPLIQARGYHSAAVANGNIYVMGGYNTSDYYLNTTEMGTTSPTGGETVALQNVRAGVVNLDQGDILVAPNVLDRSVPFGYVSVIVRGDPNERVKVRIYNEIGRLMGTLQEIVLDNQGYGEIAYKGQELGEHYLGQGMYWVRAEGDSSVDDKKPIIIRIGGR